jgi:hypothetical protein
MGASAAAATAEIESRKTSTKIKRTTAAARKAAREATTTAAKATPRVPLLPLLMEPALARPLLRPVDRVRPLLIVQRALVGICAPRTNASKNFATATIEGTIISRICVAARATLALPPHRTRQHVVRLLQSNELLLRLLLRVFVPLHLVGVHAQRRLPVRCHARIASKQRATEHTAA